MATIKTSSRPSARRPQNDRVFILPYNKYSKGFKSLCMTLDVKYPRLQDIEVYLSEPTKEVPILINWGSGSIPPWLKSKTRTILNATSAVNICRNKLKFFDTVKDSVRVPEFTTDFDRAFFEWVKNGKVVMGRSATGSCGTDIVFYEDDPGKFQGSEFWSLYKKKKHEFRVHIFNGEVISLQQKSLRTTDERGEPIPIDTVDFRIRNHRNGFIFKRNDITVPDDVIEQAKLAFKAIEGLTFGAVDVIYNQHENKAYVLEINTAPGLEGTTLEDYTKAFKSL